MVVADQRSASTVNHQSGIYLHLGLSPPYLFHEKLPGLAQDLPPAFWLMEKNITLACPQIYLSIVFARLKTY